MREKESVYVFRIDFSLRQANYDPAATIKQQSLVGHLDKNRTINRNSLFRTRRINGPVALSEAKHLWPLLEDRISQIIRDSSLRSE
jgi:hypothetical protein